MRADGLHEEKPARRACLAASAALFGRDKRAGARRMRGGSGGGRRAGRRKGRRLPCAARTPEGSRFAGIKRKKRGEAASFPLAARPEPLPAFLRMSKRLAPKPWQPGSRKRRPRRWGSGRPDRLQWRQCRQTKKPRPQNKRRRLCFFWGRFTAPAMDRDERKARRKRSLLRVLPRARAASSACAFRRACRLARAAPPAAAPRRRLPGETPAKAGPSAAA